MSEEKTLARDEDGVLKAQRDAWIWCGRCSRCFHKRDARPGGDLLTDCAYDDCDGKLAYHGWVWEAVRMRHPEYPETPTRDRCYSGPLPDRAVMRGPCAEDDAMG
jgi:hypothetical protein